jgi:hypothetical protein
MTYSGARKQRGMNAAQCTAAYDCDAGSKQTYLTFFSYSGKADLT